MKYSMAYQVKLDIDTVILELTEKYFKDLANRLGMQIITGVDNTVFIDFVDRSRLGIDKLGRMYAE